MDALDKIGRFCNTMYSSRADRVQYARELLQKELLPHIGTEEHCEPYKVFYLGYMVNKMLMCKLGRLQEDDRDHYGKKRLDLAGPLLGE